MSPRHGLATVIVVSSMLPAAAWAADPDALWKIISGACVPHQRESGNPAPCVLVDEARGYAVLKDRVGATQFLMIPTARIGGIESAELLAPGAPSYWDDAWAARAYVGARAGRDLPRDAIGLAINAISGRSQNQLHIHVDCIRADVRQALRDRSTAIGPAWSPLTVAFDGHDYMVRRIDQATLGATDPFRLAAEGLARARDDMAHETLVLTGAILADGAEGFYLLEDHAGSVAGDRASGEELLDHDCALAHEAR
jgi:CDP-diacylglycerol pyrophosphatase